MKIKLKSRTSPQKRSSALLFDLYIRKPLWKNNGIDRFISLLCEYSELMPDIWFKDGRRQPFSWDSKDQIIDNSMPYWFQLREEKVITFRYIYFLKKKSPKYQAGLRQFTGPKEVIPNDINIYFDADTLNESHLINVISLVRELCNIASIDFGRLQYYLPGEEALSGISSVINARQLYYEYIPDLYNITIWGKPYIDFFGKEKLLQAPCYKVEELTSGLVWMQLTPEIVHESASWIALEKIRTDVIRYLNNNAFRDLTLSRKEPSANNYNIPKFDLSEIQAPIPLELVKDGEEEH